MNNNVRISCAALARIPWATSRSLVLIRNSAAHRRGTEVFTPIGGALQADASGLRYLRGLGARLEKAPDLRFTIPRDQIPAVVLWFGSRRGREINVDREMREKLIDEEGIFTPDTYPAIRGLLNPPRFNYQWGTGTDGQGETLRLVEVYDLGFHASAIPALEAAANEPHPRLCFATWDEIAIGRTGHGRHIGAITKTLYDPRKYLSWPLW